MYKTTENETKEKIAVDVNTLASMLCIGRNSAYGVGKAAGAVIKVGRRTLFNVRWINKSKAYCNLTLYSQDVSIQMSNDKEMRI